MRERCVPFQCSSASRKFLNILVVQKRQRDFKLSVLFSEPKIPQSPPSPTRSASGGLSVLFSEPKIPQSDCFAHQPRHHRCFQCSSASRKFLNLLRRCSTPPTRALSVLFSEPKIPQSSSRNSASSSCRAFSALQRAENSSICAAAGRAARRGGFQCSSASRKFLN